EPNNKRQPATGNRLPASRVHLEVRVALQRGDRDEDLARGGGRAFFGAAVRAHRPDRRDETRELFARGAFTQRTAQVEAAARVEAEQPQSVRGEAAAIAGGAERLGGGTRDTGGRGGGDVA